MKSNYAYAFTMFVFAALFTLAVPSWAGIIYTQPWNGTSNVYSSQNDTGGLGNFATVYNQFTLSVTNTITGVGWTGGYFNPPTLGPITSWSVAFYADSGGMPGPMLANFVTAGNGTETYNSTVNSIPIYDYSVGTNFFAIAGVSYWLSVVPDLAAPPQWGWATSNVGNNQGFQCFFGNCNYLDPVGINLAFDLRGAEAPEPGTLVLLASGLVGAASLVRRKVGL